MPTIEKVNPEDIPDWNDAPRRAFKEEFRDIAKLLSEEPVETAIRVPIAELTTSNLRGRKLAESLKSALQKYKREFQIGVADNELLAVRCDNDYAYFIRHLFTERYKPRFGGRKGKPHGTSASA